MTSHPPAAGVPSGGNGKFILLALLLIGGVGGVIVWGKSRSEPPAPVGPIPSSAFPSHKAEDSVPPPVVVEDSGAPAPKVAAAPTNGCEKTCNGTATPEIETALQQRAKQSRVCYDKALATDPTLKGKMSLSVKIGSNGSVCSVSVGSNDIGNDFIAQCATNLFRTSAFANPKGGCVEATIPLNFQPR